MPENGILFPPSPTAWWKKERRNFPFDFHGVCEWVTIYRRCLFACFRFKTSPGRWNFTTRTLEKKERSFVDGALPLMGGKTMFGLADVFRRGKRRTWWLFAGTRLQGECRPAGLSIFGYSTQHGENKLTWSIFCADVSWIRFIEPGTTTTTELTRCNSSFATNYNWSYYFRFSHCFGFSVFQTISIRAILRVN